MTGPESRQDKAPATEQIATAGSADKERTISGEQPPGGGQTQRPASATQGAASSDLGVDDQPHAQLLEDNEPQAILVRWKNIQAQFVDEPKRAVQDADALVADIMQRLARMFTSERDQLESRWASGNDLSTEDLRRDLRRYRSFFERLLAA